MVRAKSNETARMHFTVFDTDGLTPLTGQAGGCTDSLLYNGATSAQVVTIAEIGVTGHYIASFTPNAIGDWDLEVTCPDDRVVGESFEVESIDLDDLNNLSSADIQTIIENNDLDHLLKVAHPTGVPVIDSIIDYILNASAGQGYDRQYDSLEILGFGIGLAGPVLTDILTDTNEIQGKLPTNEMMGSSTKADKDDEIDDILVDTNEIQGKLPANDIADQTLIDSDLTNIESKIDIIDTNVDLIKPETDKIQTIDDNVDLILEDTGTTLPATLSSMETNIIAEIDANETKIDALQTDLTEALSRLLRVLSLTNENVVMEHSFDVENKHSGWTAWCYNSKANADTHNKSTGLLETYTMTVTYDGSDNPTITKIVRNP